MLAISLRRIDDRNVYPLVHVSLVLIFSLISVDIAIIYVERDVPWNDICSLFNSLAGPKTLTLHGFLRPLPEDFAMREFFWFSTAETDDQEHFLEMPSMAALRVQRIL